VVEDISTGSLAVFPHLVGRLEVAGGQATYSVASLASSVPGGAAAAEALFRDRSTRMFEALEDDAGVDAVFTAAERAELTALLVDFNERFFGGTGRLSPARAEARRLDVLLAHLDPGFLTAYGASLGDDETPLSVADRGGRLVFDAAEVRPLPTKS
jgi:hypothetical protein